MQSPLRRPKWACNAAGPDIVTGAGSTTKVPQTRPTGRCTAKPPLVGAARQRGAAGSRTTRPFAPVATSPVTVFAAPIGSSDIAPPSSAVSRTRTGTLASAVTAVPG